LAPKIKEIEISAGVIGSSSDDNTAALLRAYSKAGDVENTLKVYRLRRLKKYSLNHSLPSTTEENIIREYDDFTLLTRAFARANAITPIAWRVMENPTPQLHFMLKEMELHGVELTVDYCNDMINAYARAAATPLTVQGEYKSEARTIIQLAIEFIKAVERGQLFNHKPLKLGTESYNILLKVCCRSGEVNAALNVLEGIMPQASVKPDTISYNTLIHASSKIGDSRTCEDLFVLLGNKGLRPTTYSVEGIVASYLQQRNVSKCVSVVQSCFNQHTILPRAQCMYDILKACLAERDVNEAKRFVFLLQQVMIAAPTLVGEDDDLELILGEYAGDERFEKESLMKLFVDQGFQLEEKDFVLQ
jgi:pentatricopeptide repeat protein